MGVGFSQEYSTGCVEGNPPDMLHNFIMEGNENVEHQDKGVRVECECVCRAQMALVRFSKI